MKPTNLTVFELFERQQRYVVPLFQRPYVWSLEKQWIPLWEDIMQKAEEVLNSRRADHREPSKHFLGAIVLNPIKTSGLQVAAKSIIDGQQRLTTLQIVLVALRDYMRNNGKENLLRDVELLTLNQCSMEQPIEQYKVWPTNADQELFEKIFNAGSPEKVQQLFPPVRRKYKRHPDPPPRLVAAYYYYYSSIQSYVTQTDVVDVNGNQIAANERLEALVEAFKRHLEIVTIDLDEKDNPQVIFETLNYRGEPLLPSDLIRNFVFLEAARQKEDVQRLYNSYWLAYDRPGDHGELNFWKVSERQGRLLRPRIDLFVFHYLVYKTEQDVYITRLYQEFRQWWNSKSRQVETELGAMARFSTVFRSFYEPDKQSRLALFIQRLRRLEVSTLYPFLLLLLGENPNQISTAEIDGMAADLESYLVRRLVCGLTTKNYNNIFLALLRNTRRASMVNRATLQQLLLNLSGDSARWPDDKEFEERWLYQPVYRTMGSSRLQLILGALDLQLRTHKQEGIYPVVPLTVEHVLPQGWSPSNWPLPTMPELSEEEALARRANLLHTFGNLTLLTKALNSEVSNGPFAKKRQAITEQSELRLNAYFQNFSNQDVWNEENIVARSRELLPTAVQIWPFPTVGKLQLENAHE
jgi:uncharacterized protein with ParB-like and HNH nuclease domain